MSRHRVPGIHSETLRYAAAGVISDSIAVEKHLLGHIEKIAKNIAENISEDGVGSGDMIMEYAYENEDRLSPELLATLQSRLEEQNFIDKAEILDEGKGELGRLKITVNLRTFAQKAIDLLK